MGKIKIRVVGDETLEQEQKEEQKKRREEKKLSKAKSASGGKAKVAGVGLGGGQRINTVGISEEDIAKELETEAPDVSNEEKLSEAKSTSGGKAKRSKKAKARARSKRHTENSSLIARKTSYPVSAGIEILRKFKKSNFDETVELHINTREKGISGQITLPHGTGKKLRIAIVNDDLIAQIEKGAIDFDVLVAEPQMMPKLAKVARVLGPRGLMPNPKSGTISDKPEQVVEKLSAGQVSYKTEAQAPIIHMTVGKLSFDDKKLEENISTALSSIGPAKINNVTLKSTMSPAVRINIQ